MRRFLWLPLVAALGFLVFAASLPSDTRPLTRSMRVCTFKAELDAWASLRSTLHKRTNCETPI